MAKPIHKFLRLTGRTIERVQVVAHAERRSFSSAVHVLLDEALDARRIPVRGVADTIIGRKPKSAKGKNPQFRTTDAASGAGIAADAKGGRP